MQPALPRDILVHRALHALGGEATVGDVMAVTALAAPEIECVLESLIADGRTHVRVSGSGDVVYHLGPIPSRRALGHSLGPPAWARPRTASRARAEARRTVFDRKTAQLIRAREGVLSIAELVEHTGLRVAHAEREMARLVTRWGGVGHLSLDGHVVWAFPELMASAHGRFPDREPRPAWVRSRAPVAADDCLLRLFGPSRKDTLRRHALGLVIQTALAGKGVVSLERTVAYLRSRAAGGPVRRYTVEGALRQLAVDFDAPVTELNGDLFFGFRKIKRQFLASQTVRRRLRLGCTASGATIFDSADPPARATERDLEAFDRELRKPMTPLG